MSLSVSFGVLTHASLNYPWNKRKKNGQLCSMDDRYQFFSIALPPKYSWCLELFMISKRESGRPRTQGQSFECSHYKFTQFRQIATTPVPQRSRRSKWGCQLFSRALNLIWHLRRLPPPPSPQCKMKIKGHSHTEAHQIGHD